MGSPWDRAIAAVVKPLAFAARDDFARAGRVKDLERSVAAAARAARALAIPVEAERALGEVERLFAEPLDDARRADVVKRALAKLAPFRAADFAERALARPVSALPGVGAKRAETLARRGLGGVADLLFHLPTRYDDRRALTRVADLEVGGRATFVARVLAADFATRRGRFPRKGGRSFQAIVGDESGTVTLKWFHGGDAISKTVRKDARLLITGDVKRYRFDKELLHPEVDPLDAEEDSEAERRANVVPDYPTPEGLHPRTLRNLVLAAVAQHADLVAGFLPAPLVQERELPEPAQALRSLHAPGSDADVEALRERRSRAHVRLVLEELFLLEVGLALRQVARTREPGISVWPGRDPGAAQRALPFRLTQAQRRVWREIRADLARPHPMNRLIQGDVGSGKTVLAFLAALAVAERGHQAALMAPTELLAEQHARTLEGLAAASRANLRIALLTASLPRPETESVRRALAGGVVDLVVGTHALLQGGVAFRSLALAVVDEQHRFGVLQRAALGAKVADEVTPHMLVMTATPIPRTLSMTLYGDLDLSVLDELPPGRQPVRTLLLRSGEGRRVVELLRETTQRGEQVYVVYPLVEESEKSDLRAASESAERIAAAFPDLRVDLVHGQQGPAARREAMGHFAHGETDVLVSTTVIEVGVDVPNATLMIVEHAERFGLAQLHQLRGRIGRGARPGTCVLVARGVTEDSEARLQALLSTTDGFRIADADLRIRGPGEFLGTRQHGRVLDLRLADLVRDARLLAVARKAAQRTVRDDPRLARSPDLARVVDARWGARLALTRVG